MSESVPERVKDDIVDLADREGVEVDTIVEKAVENYEDLEAKYNGAMPSRKMWSVALSSVEGEIMNEKSMGGDPVDIITIGRSRVQNWGDNDDPERQDERPVVIGHGIAQPEGERMGIASIILDTSEGITLQEAFNAFTEPWNTFRTNFFVGETDAKELQSGWVLNVASNTDLTSPESYEGDDSTERIHELADRFIDDVRLTDLVGPGGPSLSERESSGHGTRPVDFGIDIKRIPQAKVVDTYRDDDRDAGNFTIVDDSIVDQSELQGTALLDGDSQRTAGLTCWCDPQIVDHGPGSVGDFYGVIDENDGHITMDLRGVDIFLSKPRGESPGDRKNQETEKY